MITFRHKGDFGKTDKFLRRASKVDILGVLHKYGRKGVAALAAATPMESGLTASSWDYEVSMSRGSCSITWTNSHVNKGVPIAIILQYGHGTGTGGWVQGRDYINPAIQPIFDELANDAWKEVTMS